MASVLMIVLFSLGPFFSLIFVFHFHNIFLDTLTPFCFYSVRVLLKILLRVLVFIYFLLHPFLKVGACVLVMGFLGGGVGREVCTKHFW